VKILAIADEFFTPDLVEIATRPAIELGATVEVRRWAFPSRAALQDHILRIEQSGPAAIPIPDPLAEPVDHDILLIQFAPLQAEVLDRAQNLKAIIVNRAGTENVDLAAAASCGIAVINTEGRNARAVAEFTVGLIIAELRNIARSHAALKKGSWVTHFPNSAWTPELKDRIVGLVGYGRIARIVSELLSGFGCRLQAFDPHVDDAVPENVALVDCDKLLSTSDVISLHARLTSESHHLIGARELALVKPTAIIVNTARAGLIDDRALVAALEEGRLGGAALDVYDREPARAQDPLVASERTTVTSHLAGTTVDGFREGPRLVADTLRRLLSGGHDVQSVNAVPVSVTADSRNMQGRP
jgi:D-3-phosphoglycerate dehydrogenase